MICLSNASSVARIAVLAIAKFAPVLPPRAWLKAVKKLDNARTGLSLLSISLDISLSKRLIFSVLGSLATVLARSTEEFSPPRVAK